MNHSVHLTVDMDYWWGGAEDILLKDEALAFMGRVVGLQLPINVVVSHEEIVPFIKASNTTKVVNVDQHDDLIVMLEEDPDGQFMNEGNWVSYLPDGMAYNWRYPPGEGCFCDGCNGRATWGECWTGFTKRRGLSQLPWSQITSVSVCLSPTWTNYDVVLPALKMLSRSKGCDGKPGCMKLLELLAGGLSTKTTSVYKALKILEKQPCASL